MNIEQNDIFFQAIEEALNTPVLTAEEKAESDRIIFEAIEEALRA